MVISVLDKQKVCIYDASPRSVFMFEAFDSLDPEASERRWGVIESKLHGAYQRIAKRTIFDSPEHVELLIDVMALHWARSPVWGSFTSARWVQRSVHAAWRYSLIRPPRISVRSTDLSALAPTSTSATGGNCFRDRCGQWVL
jgi:hypothetical protein